MAEEETQEEEDVANELTQLALASQEDTAEEMIGKVATLSYETSTNRITENTDFEIGDKLEVVDVLHVDGGSGSALWAGAATSEDSELISNTFMWPESSYEGDMYVAVGDEDYNTFLDKGVLYLPMEVDGEWSSEYWLELGEYTGDDDDDGWIDDDTFEDGDELTTTGEVVQWLYKLAGLISGAIGAAVAYMQTGEVANAAITFIVVLVIGSIGYVVMGDDTEWLYKLAWIVIALVLGVIVGFASEALMTAFGGIV